MPKQIEYDLKFKLSKNKHLHFYDMHIDTLVITLIKLLDEHYEGMGIKMSRNCVYNLVHHKKGVKPLKAICEITKHPKVFRSSTTQMLELKKLKSIIESLNSVAEQVN